MTNNGPNRQERGCPRVKESRTGDRSESKKNIGQKASSVLPLMCSKTERKSEKIRKPLKNDQKWRKHRIATAFPLHASISFIIIKTNRSVSFGWEATAPALKTRFKIKMHSFNILMDEFYDFVIDWASGSFFSAFLSDYKIKRTKCSTQFKSDFSFRCIHMVGIMTVVIRTFVRQSRSDERWRWISSYIAT